MQRIALVTDSAVGVSAEWAEENGVTLVPLSVNLDGRAYLDGVELDNRTFYRWLRSSPTVPKTSGPTVGQFMEVFRRLSADHDEIVCVLVSGALSGTLASARLAVEGLRLTDPGAAKVHLVDSRSTAAPQVLLLTAARRRIAEGASAEEVVQHIEAIVPKTRFLFTVVTLEYLKRGGRIGGAAALAGSALQIRPVLEIRDGVVDAVEKVRTSRRARRRVVELLAQEFAGVPVHACAVHADDPEAAQELVEALQQHLDVREMLTVEFGPVVGTHSGPGAVGMAVYPEQ